LNEIKNRKTCERIAYDFLKIIRDKKDKGMENKHFQRDNLKIFSQLKNLNKRTYKRMIT